MKDFEEGAKDRMYVLKAIETAKTRGKKRDETRDEVKKVLREKGLDLTQRPSKADEMHSLDGGPSRKDTVSHFTLRIAYCTTEENRRWFLQQECALFKNRFELLPPEERAAFLNSCDMGYQPLSREQFEAVQQSLEQVLLSQGKGLSMNGRNIDHSDFYKVPFEDVILLVRDRRVFISKGEAYVHAPDLVELVLGQFRARLSRALLEHQRIWAMKMDGEEERLQPLLKNLTNAYMGPDHTKPGGVHDRLTIADIDAVAKRSFPLCMKAMYKQLKEAGHLKYGGRQQFQLFLKAIGLTLEDALHYWRTEFARSGIDGDKFEKNYAYNIRHNYGQEGKRADYREHSCLKIIGSSVGTGDSHGCPYRHYDNDRLKAMLQTNGVSTVKANEIASLAKGQHYQIACSKCFEVTHQGADEIMVNLPSDYVGASTIHHKAKQSGGAAQGGTVKTGGAIAGTAIAAR